MHIWHRYSGILSASDAADLVGAAQRVEWHKPDASGGEDVCVQVHEQSPSFPLALSVAEKYSAARVGPRRALLETVGAEFSEAELARGRWLKLQPDWLNGYPEPNPDDFGYDTVTYDGKRCTQCGVGNTQIAPFRMKKPPRWGRRSLMSLNWVFGDYFTNDATYESVFRPLGVGSRPVLTRHGDATLPDVVQLVARERVGMEPGAMHAETCTVCGSTKYNPYLLGPLPPLLSQPSGHFAQTTTWHGSGAEAHHEMIVSQELAKRLRERKARGVSFWPVAGPDWFPDAANREH